MDQVTSHPELIRRWTQMFKFYDVNNDGFITREDFELLQQTIMNKKSLTIDKRAEVMKFTEDFWENFHIKDSFMNLNEWLANMDRLHKQGGTVGCTKQMRTRLFYCMDLNGDNLIDFEEFLIFADCFGKSNTPYMERAFKAIDVDGDGVISLDEYVNAFLGFINDVSFDAVNCPLFGIYN